MDKHLKKWTKNAIFVEVIGVTFIKKLFKVKLNTLTFGLLFLPFGLISN